MAIQVTGYSGTIMDVDDVTCAVRVTARPANYGRLGAFRGSLATGLLPAALAADSELLQVRWTDRDNLFLLQYLSINAVAQADATAAGSVSMNLFVARNWTAAAASGFTANPVTPALKMDTCMGASLVDSMRVATTAALTVGTRTLDTSPVATIAFSIGTAAAGTALNRTLLPTTTLFTVADGRMPIVITQNEGVILRTGAAFPASLTWRTMLQLTWLEVARF
jgi:hypothetical protein